MADKQPSLDFGSRELPEILSILPLFDATLFPKMVVPVVIMQRESIQLVDEAMSKDRTIGLILSKNSEVKSKYTPDDLYKFGTTALILKMAKNEDNRAQLLVQGLGRFKVKDFIKGKPYLQARVENLQDIETKSKEIDALMANLIGLFTKIVEFSPGLSPDILSMAKSIQVPGKEKKSYGKLRAWGSISFIVIVIVLGRIIDIFSIEIIIAVILAGSLLQAFISVRIPDVVISKKKSFTPKAKVLLKRRLTVFLFCAFLMLVSHGTYYAFFSIHLDSLGYGKTFIGITWAMASMAEILVMIKSDKIFKRFSLENVLVFSFMIATLRWLILFFVKSPALILISQLFHAISYGAFHIASILYIDLLTPDEAKTLGQAANNAVTYGLGMTVGFLFNGYLYESVGSFNLFIISSLIALSGGVIFKLGLAKK